MSESRESGNDTTGDDISLDELFPDVELTQSDDDAGYENHAELDHDLDELMGRSAELPDPEPEPVTEAEMEAEPEVEAEPEIDVDAELEVEPDLPRAPVADGEVPVLEEKVDPSRLPHAGLTDDELGKLADLLTADLEARLDAIIVEAVDHEMERVSTALKNSIHRQLKGRLPDIIAEFVSETRSL